MTSVYQEFDVPPRDFAFALPNLLPLFSGGESGFFYSPFVASSLFQDSAGTVPAVLNGDLVGRINDLSPNGNHLTTPNANRPSLGKAGYNTHLAFSGVGQWLFRTGVANTEIQNFEIHMKYVGTTTGLGPRVMYEGPGTAANDVQSLSAYLATSGYAPENQQQRWVGLNETLLIGPNGAPPAPLRTYSLIKQGTQAQAFVNGSLIAQQTVQLGANLAGTGRISLGASYASGNIGFRPFGGRIGAAFKIGRILTAQERALVLAYMRRYPMV